MSGRVLPPPAEGFDIEVPVAVVGAGACGLVAALAAREAGAEVLVIERDPVPRGSTAMSSGMIPAAGTRFQRARGIDDSPEPFAADIMAKNGHKADPAIVRRLTEHAGPTVEWLVDAWGIPLRLVEGFRYPGHSRMRMHAPPSRTGMELIGALTRAAQEAGVDLVTEARATDLLAVPGEDRVAGLRLERPDGQAETVGCAALVLACNGYGGAPDLVRRHIPEMADALYYGHAGNQGDAVRWGEALGARLADMSAYQGHGSLAVPHEVLITWALMMQGGIQVNTRGERFSNEHQGYSEQAALVLRQPGHVAWNIYDERIHALGLEFEDYRQAVAAGAVKQANDAAALAALLGLPSASLVATLAEVAELARGEGRDRFGRDFTSAPPLTPPYYAVKVTGALFHTQGGLEVNVEGRVIRADGAPLPNLFAGGGAARGVSGSSAAGYLSGNGLLSAVVLGHICGRNAAYAATGAGAAA